MCDLWTIYKYEMKKLIGRKLLWISTFLCIICTIISAFAGLLGTYYEAGEPIESNYEVFQKDRAYRKALSGKCMDEDLLRETVDGYRQITETESQYVLTDEYEIYARPYSDIFNIIRSWTGMNLSEIQNWEVDEDALYEARMQYLESNWQSILLTENEKEFWRDQENQIEKPLLYMYHEGYENILESFLTCGVLMLLFVAICLANLFSDEHVRRTDQLVLSSIGGKDVAYWAKIFAGVSVAIGVATLLTFMVIGLSLGVYGTEGYEMPIQSCLLNYSYPITIGQACLIAYAVLIIASILAAVFVMVISELFRSGIVALAISTGLIILGNVIMIPTQYRVIAQIWDWLPMAYLSIWNVFDTRTFCLLGHCFTSWQVVSIGYIVLSVLLAFWGKYIYQRYQVSGR